MYTDSMKDMRRHIVNVAIWAVLVLLSLSAAGGMWWKVYAIMDDVREAHETLVTQERERERVTMEFSQVVALREYVDTLRGGFADSENPLPLIRTIEAMGDRLRISVEVGRIEESAGGKAYRMPISCEGSYEAVYDFIRLLQHSPYFFDIQTVVAEQVSAQQVWRARMTVKIPVEYH
jgi:hypothetical protein